MKEVYREVCQPFNEEGGLHFSCVWKLKVIPCIPFFWWKAYWNRLSCKERTSCLKEFSPIVLVFFYVCEGVVEDIDHVLVKCTVANQVWMVGLPELFELELWTLRGIGCLPY